MINNLSNPLLVKKNQIYIYYSKIVFKIIINKTEKIFPLLVDLRFSQELSTFKMLISLINKRELIKPVC